MTKHGRRSLTSGFAAVILMAGLTGAPTPVFGGDTFLVPGVALRDAEFQVGAWCRYLVVDEIMGQRDSTSVYIAVTGKTHEESGEAYRFELQTGPYGAPPSGFDTFSALISSDIKNLSPHDSVGQYVSEVYIKRGTDVPRPADPAEVERLALTDPTSESDWKLVPGEIVETPHRRFTCDHKHLVVEDNREIPMGRITLVKSSVDVYDVWFNDEVPIFRVVKSVIERIRNTRTKPAVPGIPNKESEESRTTIEMIDFGTDAKPTFEIP